MIQQKVWRPYLIERDDPIGLIGRLPLDVDLLLEGPALNGFQRNSSWNCRREKLGLDVTFQLSSPAPLTWNRNWPSIPVKGQIINV